MIATKSALADAESQLRQASADRKKEWLAALTDTTAKLDELEQGLAKHSNRVERLDIRAPVAGIVQEMVSGALDEVIRPGTQIATVVPVDRTMVAEVKITPADIGHVKIGHKANVKVTAFDSEVYGTVEGELVNISPSTFETEKDEFFYKGTIELASPNLMRGSTAHPLMPGMMVNGEIITGSKTMIRYLLKPIYRSLNKAFTEH